MRTWTPTPPIWRATPGLADDLAAVEPFEAFYRGHLDRIYRALAVTLADPQLAREAADEAMARAYAHWHRVRGLDNPG
ncbi:MAG: hypothetical protein GEV12_14000 [Micromonosporaceae bacterium]|nr:hypothetical protein [Micromonosporaceae bacterium]